MFRNRNDLRHKPRREELNSSTRSFGPKTNSSGGSQTLRVTAWKLPASLESIRSVDVTKTSLSLTFERNQRDTCKQEGEKQVGNSSGRAAEVCTSEGGCRAPGTGPGGCRAEQSPPKTFTNQPFSLNISPLPLPGTTAALHLTPCPSFHEFLLII